MTFSVRRRRREAVALMALALPALVACEDAVEFTEPETVAFTAIAIDKASVRPREGERLTAGPALYDVEVEVRYQNLPSSSVLGVWVETHDSVTGQTFRWEGDVLAETLALSGSSGTVSLSQSVRLPVVSPFCGSYDYARILAVAFPGGNSPPNEAYRDEVFYQVSGSNWSGPCVANVFGLAGSGDFRIGEPFLVYGRALPGGLDVSLPGAQQGDNVWPVFVRPPETVSLYPVPNDGYVIAFVPVGAESGRLRAFAGGNEVRYGPDGETTLSISTSPADFLEPNNTPGSASDSIYFNLLDPFAEWGAYGFNPSLTLAGADRNPDALAPNWGEGDWFYLYQPFFSETPVVMDLCVNVASHLGDLDDLDVFVYDADGAVVTQSATASGSEAIRVDDVGSSDVYWVWVAPWLAGFTSDAGGYTYEVGQCASSTGTAIARPDGPRGFFGSSDAPAASARALRDTETSIQAVRVPASGAARVPISELQVRGGER